MPNRIIQETELIKFGDISLLSDKALVLLEEQKTVWELLHKNYNDFKNNQIKNFKFNNIEICLQFNPARIRSTSAKVDSKSINERRCFLCLKNLPEEQLGVLFNSNFIILCNPFPIFKKHFTIVHKNHISQTIIGNFEIFLEMAKELGDKLTVFYNGPKCGASAPDHLHFQAGSKGSMPIENEIEKLKNQFGKKIFSKENTTLFAIDDGLRKMFLLKGIDKVEIADVFYKFIHRLQSILRTTEEPMLNIIGLYERNEWKIIIFPRDKHRPDFYFFEDKDKIMVSPASVDMSGLIIVPRKEDFHQLDENKIVKIYDQVCLSKNVFYKLSAI